MKKLILSTLIAIIPALSLLAQSVAIYAKNGVTMFADPEQVGEMIVSGGQINIGKYTFPVSDLDSLKYLDTGFNPQLVEIAYTANDSRINVPLNLLDSLEISKDGAYITVTSHVLADPEITYSLSGKTDNGNFLLVGDYKCGLILNNVDITSQNGAAIRIKNGKRIDVIMPENTINNLYDSFGGTQDACFHIKGHPEFKGGGTLNITGNSRHAFKSGEYTLLKQSTGKINILSAESDAMHIGQYFQMRGGQITVSSKVKGDGIDVEKDSDMTKELNGMVFLDSGLVDINLASDDVSGIKCDSTFTCNGGQYNITVSGKASKGINVPYDAHIFAVYDTPRFNLTASGGYLVEIVGGKGDKKKSSCFKVDGNIYFHAGNIITDASGDKARGLKVDGDYYYVPSKATLSPADYSNIGGAMRVMTE